MVPVPTGSAIWHNGLTFHSAGPNRTNKPHRAMTCAYMPDGATYNGKHHPTALEDWQPKEGDVLNRDDLLPLIYSEKQSLDV